MKSKKAVKTFASLRFMGDRLDPERVTEILHVSPTMAYRRGQIYKQSGHHQARGRTGLWLLSSEGHVQSADLTDHLAYLLKVIHGSREAVSRLRSLMQAGDVEADVACFWSGGVGTTPPAIPPHLRKGFDEISAPVELETPYS
jgi:hypothetical protein